MAKLEDLKLTDIGNTIQLAGAIYEGNGKMFLCLFPDERQNRESVVDHLEMDFDDWKTFIKQTDLLEAEVLARDPATKEIVKAIVRKSQRQIDQVVSWKVYRRDNYECRYCGQGEVPLTVDHIICWEEGGPSTEANLNTSCKKCNRTRGNLPYTDWLETDFYKRRSSNLRPEILDANRALVATLGSIPRAIHRRSR